MEKDNGKLPTLEDSRNKRAARLRGRPAIAADKLTPEQRKTREYHENARPLDLISKKYGFQVATILAGAISLHGFERTDLLEQLAVAANTLVAEAAGENGE